MYTYTYMYMCMAYEPIVTFQRGKCPTCHLPYEHLYIDI